MTTNILRVAILDDYERVMATHPSIRAVMDGGAPNSRPIDLTVFDQPLGGPVSMVHELAGFDAVCLIRERTPFPASLIAALPRLRYLAFTGARNPSCDHEAAAQRGIPVSNTPGGPSKAATAELAFALIMACAKRLVAADAGLRAGHWRGDDATGRWPLPAILEGRTLGLLGLGDIGQRVAGYGRAFGMNTIAWSPNLTDERAAAHSVTRVDKASLFANSDVLSIHLVLADSTRAIIGSAELASMKPDAMLVNTSRAGLIDSPALVQSLARAPQRQVALDVFNREPLDSQDPLAFLLGSPNAVLSPHLGYVNEPVLDAFARGLAQILEGWAAGQAVKVINEPVVSPRGEPPAA